MKKSCVLLLILIMMLLLCACTGEDSRQNNVTDTTDTDNVATLVCGEWKDAFGGIKTMSFNEDGTCTYEGLDGTWELSGDTITIKYGTSAHKTFQVSTVDASVRLTAEDSVFVLNSQFDELCPIIRNELTASAIEVDIDQIRKENNPAKRVLDYDKKICKVTLTVLNIHSDYVSYIMMLSDGLNHLEFRVYLPIEVMAALTVDEEITVICYWDEGTSTNTAYLRNAFIADDYITP